MPQRRLKLSAQSDQSLRCPHEETLHSWLYKMCLIKILTRQTDLKLRWAHIFEDRLSDVAAQVLGDETGDQNLAVLKETLTCSDLCPRRHTGKNYSCNTLL